MSMLEKEDRRGVNIANSDKNSLKRCAFHKDFWQIQKGVTLEGSKGKFLGFAMSEWAIRDPVLKFGCQMSPSLP